jgi:hypothetical protein
VSEEIILREGKTAMSDSRRIFPVLSLIKKRWIFFSEYIVEVFNHGDERKFERIP